jgi:hypothetical protein
LWMSNEGSSNWCRTTSSRWRRISTWPPNIQMEPTRSTVRAMMSPKRAAHLAR